MVDQLVVGFDLDMTLIDTAPGFRDVLRGAGRRARGRVPGRGDDRQARPAARPAARALPRRRRDRRRGRPVPRALPRPRDRRARPRSTARTRRSPPYAATAAGSWSSPASTPPTRSSTSTTSAFDVDHLEGWVWGVGKADVLRREGASIYVGDHVHDVEGALAAGALSVSVLTGGCTREELVAAGTHVVLDDLGEFPAWLDEHLLDLRLAALEADLRERGSVLVAYSGGADSAFLLAAAVRALGADQVAAATGYSHSLPMSERDPAREFAESPRRRGADPRDPRDGARGLPRQRRRPLLLLQGRAARRAHPDRRRARAGPRRDRHQRRRRGRRLPARHPGRGRARRDHPAARRRAHQGADPRGLAPLGPADLGQARRRLPLLAGRVRRRGHAVPARPGGARRGRRPRRCSPTPGCVNLRVRDLGDRASVEIDAALLPLAAGGRGRRCSTPYARPASTRPTSTPADSVRDR